MPNIIIVDDDLKVSEQIEAILKDIEVDCLPLLDPSVLFENLDYEEPDLIVLDIHMPGISGIQLLRELKEHQQYQHIPVIMITGDFEASLLATCFEIGATDFLKKPIEASELQARIQSSLKIHQYETQLEKLVEERTKQLVHGAKLASLGQLSASLAHELRQPLQVLEMASDMALEDFENGVYDHLGTSLRSIRKGTKKAVKIIQRMRTFSHKGDGVKAPADIVRIIDYVMVLFDKELSQKNIKIHKELPQNLPELFCDPMQIEQILVNLIGNAGDALEDISEKMITIRIIPEDNWLKIEVEDNAAGIPEEVLPHIFEAFFTTKSAEIGTGLGLSICQTLAANNGGELSVKSAHGQGSVFSLALPLKSSLKN